MTFLHSDESMTMEEGSERVLGEEKTSWKSEGKNNLRILGKSHEIL